MKIMAVAFVGLTLVLVLVVLCSTQRRNSDPVPQAEAVPWTEAVPRTEAVPQPKELQLSMHQEVLKKYKISCCKIASQHTIEELCPVSNIKSKIGKFGDGTCSCTQFLKCKLTLVAAISQNHFIESLDLFGSVYAKLPQKKVIVYDLGLNLTQLHAVQSYCNVEEVRKFDFDKYPEHFKNLNNFAWKPIIVEEISLEFELFLYCDASCRISDGFVPFLPNVLKFPIISLAMLPKAEVVFRYTHQGMLDYLNVNKTRKEMIHMMPVTYQAGVILVWANHQFMTKILPYWADCARHVDCIAPEGATKSGCNSTGKPFTAYIGCHRFDQSALNVILIREFGNLLGHISFNKKAGQPLRVQRSRTSSYNNSRSQQCHIEYPPKHSS